MNKRAIFYKKSVSKDFKKIDKKQRQKIKKTIEKRLSADPNSRKKLKGKFAGLRRISIGNYRVLYIIIKSKIIILRIGSGQGFYKK